MGRLCSIHGRDDNCHIFVRWIHYGNVCTGERDGIKFDLIVTGCIKVQFYADSTPYSKLSVDNPRLLKCLKIRG